jgi:hypothetical protein
MNRGYNERQSTESKPMFQGYPNIHHVFQEKNHEKIIKTIFYAISNSSFRMGCCGEYLELNARKYHQKINKKFWKELICLLSLHYLKMSFA